MARQTVRGLLQTYGERAKTAALQSLRENAETVAAEARRLCPVDTGKLQGSIHTEPKGENKVRVIADAEKKGYYYGRLIEFSPNGKPFLRPALEAKREEIRQNTIQKIRAAIT